MTELTTRDLIRIIGRDRSAHSYADVSRAEELLTQLAVEEQQRVAERIPRNGAITAVIGFFAGVWPVVLFPTAWHDVQPAWDKDGGTLFLTIWLIAGAIQTICGAFIFIAGLKFRQRSEWGRRILQRILTFLYWFVIVYGIVFEIVIIIFMPWEPFKLPMMFIFPVVTILWAFLFSLPRKYFSSLIVRKLCAG